MRARLTGKPPILYGAYALAVLSLVWSGYAITDLMHSGTFGLSVALAGDIGWVTVLWAEHKGITIRGKRWPVISIGWVIALGVATLLVIHGNEVGGRAQAIAGPFVVLVGKAVWAIALAALNDPTAPTPEMRAELDTLMRNSAHQSAMLHARTDTVIKRIKAEAQTILAREEVDHEIDVARLEKRADIRRRTPLAIEASTTGPAASSDGEDVASMAAQMRELIAIMGDQARDRADDHDTNKQATPPITDREQGPSIADLAREQVAITIKNADAVTAILAIRPDASKPSVAAAVRRARKEAQGPYL